MKKLTLLLFAALTIGANAQTTQGISPDLISDICVVSYFDTDTTDFHWMLLHEEATSPNVAYYTLETATLANPTWVQHGFHTTADNSAFLLDTIAFDSTTYFRIQSYDSQQSPIYTSEAKPIFIRTVQESVTHTSLSFSSYIGYYNPSFYIVYRGNSPTTLAPYDSIATISNTIINYFDPEADSYCHYYQIGAVRPATCDDNNSSGWAAYNSIAMSDIALAGTVGISEEQALLNSVLLYPNPTQNNVTLSFNASLKGNVTVQVLNTFGQLVKTQLFAKSGVLKLTLDISTVPTGVYFVQVNTATAVKTLRLVKE